MKKIESMTLIALGAALIAALSPFTIPLGPIPITLQTLAIGLIASIYRPKEATLSVLIYLLLGAIGLPVFAGGHGGISSFYGPTAGFLFFFPLREIDKIVNRILSPIFYIVYINNISYIYLYLFKNK